MTEEKCRTLTSLADYMIFGRGKYTEQSSYGAWKSLYSIEFQMLKFMANQYVASESEMCVNVQP